VINFGQKSEKHIKQIFFGAEANAVNQGWPKHKFFVHQILDAQLSKTYSTKNTLN